MLLIMGTIRMHYVSMEAPGRGVAGPVHYIRGFWVCMLGS